MAAEVFKPLDRERLEVMAGLRGERPSHAVRFKDLEGAGGQIAKYALLAVKKYIEDNPPNGVDPIEIDDRLQAIIDFANELVSDLTEGMNQLIGEAGAAAEARAALGDWKRGRQTYADVLSAKNEVNTKINTYRQQTDAGMALITEKMAYDRTVLTVVVDQHVADARRELGASITTTQIGLKTLTEAQAFDRLELTAAVGDVIAALDEERLVRANDDEALAFSREELRVQVEDTQAQVSTVSVAVADLEGNAAAALVMRARAGGASGSVEIVAADNVDGPVSIVRLTADRIIMEGNVIINGSLTTTKLQDDAITRFGDSGSTQVLNDSSTYTTICSFTIDTDGFDAKVVANMQFSLSGSQVGYSTGFIVEMLIDGQICASVTKALMSRQPDTVYYSLAGVRYVSDPGSSFTVLMRMRNANGYGVGFSGLNAIAFLR